MTDNYMVVEGQSTKDVVEQVNALMVISDSSDMTKRWSWEPQGGIAIKVVTGAGLVPDIMYYQAMVYRGRK